MLVGYSSPATGANDLSGRLKRPSGLADLWTLIRSSERIESACSRPEYGLELDVGSGSAIAAEAYDQGVRRAIGVPVEHVRDLVEAPPRASIAFRSGDAVEAAPAAVRIRAGRYWIGVVWTDIGPLLDTGQLVQLVIDDGRWFFDLRGLLVRGRTAPGDQAPDGDASSLAWFEITPEKVLAWDYGTLHTMADDES